MEKIWFIKDIFLVVFLIVASLEDIKTREISMKLMIIAAIVGLILELLDGSFDIKDILGGVLIGFVLYIAAVLSKEKIGKGDGVIVMGTGIYTGFMQNLELLWIAAVISLIVGVVITLIRKKPGSLEMPFVPFLLSSYLFMFYKEYTGRFLG